MNEEHFTLPSAPPSYHQAQAVDVVQEFANRFEKRKDTIRTCFNKRRVALEKKHQILLDDLNKEESNALAQLHTSYVQWVTVEPPDILPDTTQTQQQAQQKPFFLFRSRWLF